jgi:hypothetical protein
MFELILMASLIQTIPAQTLQFQPCVWPNICKTEPVECLAQFQPCVWPNRCVKAVEEPTIKTCDWPNTCS